MICPLTNELMQDPILFEDTLFYERSAIAEFVSLFHISPLTLLPVDLDWVWNNVDS
jgi:hypothetical protein